MTIDYGETLAITPDEFPEPVIDIPASGAGEEQVAVLAGGCFWCVEAVYKPLDGVIEVASGYAGDSAASADYRSVSGGATSHAEAVEIRFDPGRISYGQLLRVFFSIAHDPTQLDRQGPDRGSHYRSAIFYADERQRKVAEAYIDLLNEAEAFDAPIVTRLEPLDSFYRAEAEHQDYAEKYPEHPYIAFNAAPKVEKLRLHFRGRLKEES